jgi:hypothetical protein
MQYLTLKKCVMPAWNQIWSKWKLQDLKKRKTKLKTTPEEPSNYFKVSKLELEVLLKKEAHNTSTYYIHL